MENNRFKYLQRKEEIKNEFTALAKKYNISNQELYKISDEIRKDEREADEERQREYNETLIGRCFMDDSDKNNVGYYKVLNLNTYVTTPYYVNVLSFEVNPGLYFHEGEDEKTMICYGFEIEAKEVRRLESMKEISEAEYNETAIRVLKKMLRMKDDE